MVSLAAVLLTERVATLPHLIERLGALPPGLGQVEQRALTARQHGPAQQLALGGVELEASLFRGLDLVLVAHQRGVQAARQHLLTKRGVARGELLVVERLAQAREQMVERAHVAIVVEIELSELERQPPERFGLLGVLREGFF